MFTGIIQAIGTVSSIEKSQKDATLHINAKDLNLAETNLGDSIAVNGVCLTVTNINNDVFSVDVSNETLQKTSLVMLTGSSKVNLEKALTLSTPLGGHLVSGHVDGVGELLSKRGDGNSTVYSFKMPESISKYVASKGSITIQGISLTTNNVTADSFDVSIIPHTESMTTIGLLEIGSKVNLEIDLVARYVERMLKVESNQEGKEPITLDGIRKLGF